MIIRLVKFVSKLDIFEKIYKEVGGGGGGGVACGEKVTRIWQHICDHNQCSWCGQSNMVYYKNDTPVV